MTKPIEKQDKIITNLDKDKLSKILERLFNQGQHFEEDGKIGEAGNSYEMIFQARQQLWLEIEKVPHKEYAECTTGGHYKDNCVNCARAYYYTQGILDFKKSLKQLILSEEMK